MASPPQLSPSENNNRWIEEQLHQEFAENYNSISSYVLAFAGSLIVGFSGYGYCLKLLLIDSSDNYSGYFILFILAYIGCIGICSAISYLSIKQGWAMRRDQFIIHAIRFRSLGKEAFHENSRWFPSGYHPFNKLKAGDSSNILVGTFQYIFLISRTSAICISIMTITVIAICYLLSGEYPCNTLLILDIPIILIIIFLTIFHYKTSKWLKNVERKYSKLENEMKTYVP